MKFGLKKKKAASGEAKIRNAYYDVIRAPVVTEKSTMAAEQNKVVFRVADHATKEDIKAAVEALFNVKVTKVNTLNRKGKEKRFKGVEGRKSDIKNAIVTLASGQNIDFAAGAR